MFHSRWLHNVLGLSHSRKNRRRQAAQSRKQVRLLLESLEERLAPAAQTAGSFAELTAAVAADTAANTNYVIDITSNFTFAAGGQVTISKLGAGSTLMIEGQNGSVFTLTGSGNRLFDIVGDNVSFKDLILTGGGVTGSTAQGGGIFAKGGSVTLSDATVMKNSVTGALTAQGGGIFVSGGGALTIKGGAVIQSNNAIGGPGTSAYGGGVYVSGASTVTIADSILSNNSATGGKGGTIPALGAPGNNGGNASGGGLFVFGTGWTVTLTGDTLSGNSATSGNGGNGSGGATGIGANTTGGSGGSGGSGGLATGGAAAFDVGGAGDSLTILNDLGAPNTHPSTFLNNSVTGGNGGSGGSGGISTGTAANSSGGAGGLAGGAIGGAVAITDTLGLVPPFTANMGNTTFYGNKVIGSNGGAGGAAGTGGSGAAGTAGTNQVAGAANGGGLAVTGGNVTLFNSTVANNSVTAGVAGGTTTQGAALGGGVFNSSNFAVGSSLALDDNTIVRDTLNGGTGSLGSGAFIGNTAATLVNNLIALDTFTTSINDLDVVGKGTLKNSTNNFLTHGSTGALTDATDTNNIVGNLTQSQLGGVVGVTTGGKTSGPIFYPLLPGAASVGAGSTSVLATIAKVEGTTAANAVDEIGNLRTTNGTIDIGAVQLNPVIASNPTSQTVTAGANVVFTASAGSTLTPTTVQWQMSTDGGSTFTNISGATSTTLTLNNVNTSANGDEFRAVFTNNGVSATTSTATLTVNAAVSPPPSPPTPPTLHVPPLLAFINSLLGGVETVNANGTETITDRFFGFTLFVSTFDSSGNLVSVDLFGFNITFLFG